MKAMLLTICGLLLRVLGLEKKSVPICLDGAPAMNNLDHTCVVVSAGANGPGRAKFQAASGRILSARVVRIGQDGRAALRRTSNGPVFHRRVVSVA